MSATDQRASRRDNILLLAQLRVGDEALVHPIRIRDLSAGGLRAQFDGRVLHGSRVAIEIRNIGWVEGSVAWQKAGFVGVHFDHPIDPRQARIVVTGNFAPATAAFRTVQRRV